MSTLSPSHLGARAKALLRRWNGDTAGMAAVEFALIAPIMGVMFIGAVELSQAIIVDRRVTQIAQSDITDIMKAGSFIMAPYSQNPLQIVMRELQSSPASASTVKQSWSCTYSGTGSTLTCGCSNTTATAPANLMTTNDSVIVSQVTYAYKPLVFDYFMKRNYASSSAGTYTLSETIYQKPRGQWPNFQQANGTSCPAPTFP